MQNTVELAYPTSKATSDGNVVVARTRFMMDTFPPAASSTTADEPETNDTGTTPTNPPSTSTS